MRSEVGLDCHTLAGLGPGTTGQGITYRKPLDEQCIHVASIYRQMKMNEGVWEMKGRHKSNPGVHLARPFSGFPCFELGRGFGSKNGKDGALRKDKK